jgi:hypothetical protein
VKLREPYTKLFIDTIILPDSLSNYVSKIGDRTIEGGLVLSGQIEADSGLIQGAFEIIGALTAGTAEDDIAFTAQKFVVYANSTMNGATTLNGNTTVNGDIVLGASTTQYKQNVLAISTQTDEAYETIGLGVYSDVVKYGDGAFEQTEIGSENMPLCLNHSMTSTNGYIADKHILVHFKDKTTGNTVDYVAYMSNITSLAAQLTNYLPLIGGTITGSLNCSTGFSAYSASISTSLYVSALELVDGLTVNNGGATIQGDSTVYGNLTVSGIITASSNVIISGTVMIQQATTLNGSLTAEAPATFNYGFDCAARWL